MSGCGTANPDALVRSLVGVADCQAAALGSDGWHALATSGMFAALLTGLLTLAVARQGYRLLAGGGTIAPADWVAMIVRMGVVIALCTSWAAYDRLVYRVAMDGPAETARVIFPSVGIETDALATRLQNAHDAIATPPVTDDAAVATPSAASKSEAVVSPGAAPQTAGLPGTDRKGAATLMVIVGAGSWMAARLALALLLAIGPFAILAALFESSAGLCIGWLRALIGASLACLVIPLALALELQMLDGPVNAAARAGTADIPGLGAIVWSFALVIATLVFAAHRLAGGLRLPRRMTMPTTAPIHLSSATAAPAANAQPTAPRITTIAPPVPVAPSRAMAIAHAAQGRTQPMTVTTISSRTTSTSTAPPAISRRGNDLADSARRSTAGRRTLSAKRLEAR